MAQTCEACGKSISKGMKFCPQCGSRMRRTDYIRINIKLMWSAVVAMGVMTVALGCIFWLLLGMKAEASTPEMILQAQLAGEIVQTPTSTLYKMPPVFAAQQPIDQAQYGNANNAYKDLKIPTQITKAGSFYFLVDCYHDQVLYTQKLGCPLNEWKVMTAKAKQPHTIASDGQVYLIDDTENNGVLVFEWKNGRFQNTQTFRGIGNRPHYVVYDAPTDSFYVWSSLTGDMYIMKREPISGMMYIAEMRRLNELYGIYVRSFTIAGERIIFPSGNNGYITIADKNTFEVVARYPVPEQISGMVQIMPIGSYYYITVSTDLNYDQSDATIIRTQNLAALSSGQYEDIYHLFKTEGTPYYISHMDGMYYMANHRSKRGICRFAVENDIVKNISQMY